MKVIVILGAAVWANGPSPTLTRRCMHAFKLWQQDQTQVLIPCGGLGKHPPAEATMMAKLLADAGVPSAHILPEDQSTTTFENIRNADLMMRHSVIEKLTIVSDKYHLPRAAMVGRYFGHRPIVSGPSLRGMHMLTQARHFAREGGAIPLYALKLIGHKLHGTDQR